MLSGGGARAASHIGILKVLEREKIPIYCIAATSFGALVGGLYSIGYSTGDIEKILAEQDWDGIFSDAPQRRLTRLIDRRNARYQGQLSFNGWNPELPTGLWEGQRLTETLDTLTTRQLLQARYDFDNLPIRFRAIATNLVDGTTYVFKQGSMTMALRASMAIPLLFKPVEKDGMLLADGGLSNNLPADVARAMGADIIIAVDATTPLLTKEEIRTFVDVIDQSISLQIERNVQESRKLANIVLQPDLEKYSNSDYSRIPEIVKIGEESAERHLEELKALAAGIPPHERSGLPEGGTPVIDTISFRGLKNIQPAQLKKNLRVQSGDSVDPARIGADVGRLYATRLFDSISYSLEPVGENRYQLVFTVKEALLRTLGASLRYDSDYTFVALAEFTARQLFHSPTTATVSAQFGGMEDHFASLRLTPANAQFFFVEPRLEARRLERQDIRDRNLVDKFTDNREAVQLMIGATISRQLDMCAGFRAERVEISGGSEPNRLAGSNAQVGFVFRLNRDSLDSQDFPRNGMLARAQFDKRNVSLGGDFDNSKFQAEYQRYFTFSGKSTFRIHAAVGYTHGEVPFYDLFYVGGYSFSESASRQFLGLERDELPVRQMGMLGAGYRRRLFSNPISFIRQGFLLGIYNGIFSSTRKESPYDFDLLHGAGISLALDTLVGPFHATGGWAEGGRFHFYISFGPAF
ncbi:MAG: patatin-like phospholipase family protein [Acidobacteria bacterium]|nr:patatin-like phospholipase family protein [Acidobacteriota bacterium]